MPFNFNAVMPARNNRDMMAFMNNRLHYAKSLVDTGRIRKCVISFDLIPENDWNGMGVMTFHITTMWPWTTAGKLYNVLNFTTYHAQRHTTHAARWCRRCCRPAYARWIYLQLAGKRLQQRTANNLRSKQQVRQHWSYSTVKTLQYLNKSLR